MKFTTWLWRWVAVPFSLLPLSAGWTSDPIRLRRPSKMNQYFYAGDLDAVGAGDPAETLAFLPAIQESDTVNAVNALACTAAACAAQAAVNLVSDGPRGPRPVSIRKKWVM